REPTDEDSPRPRREPIITATPEQPEADPEIVPVQATEPLPLEPEEGTPIPLTPPVPEIPAIPEIPLPAAPAPEAPAPAIPNTRPVQPQEEVPEQSNNGSTTSFANPMA
ncbi:MAG: hypothetical protein AAGH78_17055, partial [Cyanobacteria bacterium P01_H01_bin.58]